MVRKSLILAHLMKHKSKENKIECRFEPPLWIQRRAFVVKFLVENNVESVFDFGCGDGSLIQVLINNCRFLKLAGVDIDSEEIQLAIENCSPTEHDFMEKRELPLDLQFFLGSIDAPDAQCKDWDAITMIEVIEHLPADVLDRFPKLLFGIYKPKFVIISTPNAEYNINFPNLNYGTPNSTYRHWDHKFEWTRQEFKVWSSKVAQLYGYGVSFHDVGYFVTKNGSDVGGCTQVAIFDRLDGKESNGKYRTEQLENCTYQLISKIDFPYYKESNFTETDILDIIVREAKTIFLKEIQWKPEISASPFIISLGEIWNILEVRQMCKTLENLEGIVYSDSGLKLFNLNADKRLECLFQFPSVSVEGSDLNEIKESPPFEELCINSADDGKFDGWGQVESELLVKSGW